MRTDVDRFESQTLGRQHGPQPVMNLFEPRRIEIAPRNSRLIGDHGQRESGVPQQSQTFNRAWRKFNSVWIAQVDLVDDDRPVAIDESEPPRRGRVIHERARAGAPSTNRVVLQVETPLSTSPSQPSPCCSNMSSSIKTIDRPLSACGPRRRDNHVGIADTTSFAGSRVALTGRCRERLDSKMIPVVGAARLGNSCRGKPIATETPCPGCRRGEIKAPGPR